MTCNGWLPRYSRVRGGSHKHSGRTGISKPGRVPVVVCPWSQGAECGEGFEEACVTLALGPFPKPAGLGEAMASVWPLTGAVLMWDQDRTGQGVLLKESGWMLTAYEAPSRCTLGVAEWQGLWIWAAGAWV